MYIREWCCNLVSLGVFFSSPRGGSSTDSNRQGSGPVQPGLTRRAMYRISNMSAYSAGHNSTVVYKTSRCGQTPLGLQILGPGLDSLCLCPVRSPRPPVQPSWLILLPCPLLDSHAPPPLSLPNSALAHSFLCSRSFVLSDRPAGVATFL